MFIRAETNILFSPFIYLSWLINSEFLFYEDLNFAQPFETNILKIK